VLGWRFSVSMLFPVLQSLQTWWTPDFTECDAGFLAMRTSARRVPAGGAGLRYRLHAMQASCGELQAIPSCRIVPSGVASRRGAPYMFHLVDAGRRRPPPQRHCDRGSDVR
jgi:hypothetical protein